MLDKENRYIIHELDYSNMKPHIIIPEICDYYVMKYKKNFMETNYVLELDYLLLD